MSKYTSELRFIVENAAGLTSSVGYNDVNDVIQKAIPKIFNFSFPIFDEGYRNVLETKILKHYYTREIALETVGLWRLKLDTKLNEIMPFYNQLYQTELLKFEPFEDVNVTDTRDVTGHENAAGTGSKDGTREDNTTNKRTVDESEKVNSTSTEKRTDNETITDKENKRSSDDTTSDTSSTEATDSSSANSSTNAYSDTPQGTIGPVMDNTYLTNFRNVQDSGSTAGNSTVTANGSSNLEHSENNAFDRDIDKTGKTELSSNSDSTRNLSDSDTGSLNGKTHENTNNTNVVDSTEKWLVTRKGKQGSNTYMELLQELRGTLLNIDMQVINELKDLFFTLY